MVRRVADEITGEAEPNPEFDEAMDDAARWLGARLSRLAHPVSWTTSRAARKHVKRVADHADSEEEAALEALRSRGLVREIE